ncbi:hypothetical protein SAY86_020705 [Trapa natans]|uniref:non-specific serine/threonine protein kinase n=1 Tax=Trapa natans TaxID=22666 RepID=A0AAN7LN36_TRANT|nr:hypothetical protein SAY86_020705 [Trapa natans]
MSERQQDTSEPGPSSSPWWHSEYGEKFRSLTLGSQEETQTTTKSPREAELDILSSETASQILWNTGILSRPIPDGFYSVIPEKRLTELFNSIPTLEELQTLGEESSMADIILVDTRKDKKLWMLKQWTLSLVKGMNSNPASMIKKIGGLVSDVYKRSNLETPAKAMSNETLHMFENRGVQMLGQIKHGSCRPRAILFKVLADTVGLESRLVVGLPNDVGIEFVDSYKHLSVIVVLNSVEHVVDLMRFPGQLIPRSTKAIFMTHISAAGESDSAENDSCDSPLEPNSPMYGYSERMDPEIVEKEESPQSRKKFEASSNVPGHSSRNIMLRTASVDRKLSCLCQSEPNVATAFWRHTRRKAVSEQRTASSSPEHPSFQGRGLSILSGDRKSTMDFADHVSTTRSDGAPTPEARRIRRRSISITPEIGDDIARAVRAMAETFKQNRLSTEQGGERSFTSHSRKSKELLQNVSNFPANVHVELSGRMSPSFGREHVTSQRAISLPSSPHQFASQTTEISGASNCAQNDYLVSTWNKVLESPLFLNNPLLPCEEWNIDFSELTVGTRVGIGFFGEVFRGIWNGTEVAIKVFLEQDLTAENMEDFCNEISILSRLRHPNVILFLGACTKPPRLSMVTEYMEMGSLYFLIHSSGQKKKLTWRRRLKMLRDICRIMTELPMRDSSSAGTPEWMAPELIRNEPFTEKCDIFSLGVIMWELCTLSRPWKDVPPEKVVYSVANEGSRLEIPEGPLRSLIEDCWAEPNERPTCEEVFSRLLDCQCSLC